MNGERWRTWVLVLALVANTVAWLWGAGGKYATLEYRVAHHDVRLDRIEAVLERMTEQQALLARNLEVMSAILRERTGYPK